MYDMHHTLRVFQFRACTHIPLLREMYAWGRNHDDLEIQERARERLLELGAITPDHLRVPLRLVWDRDAAKHVGSS
jgi:hypothetical protein